MGEPHPHPARPDGEEQDVVLHESVHGAVRRLRRTLFVATSVLVALEVVAALLVPGVGPGDALVAVLATVALSAATGLVVSRATAGPETLVAWVAGGYLLKVAVVAGVLLGARAAGLDLRFVGTGAVGAVLVTLGCEVWAFLTARVPTVVPTDRGNGAPGGDPTD